MAKRKKIAEPEMRDEEIEKDFVGFDPAMPGQDKTVETSVDVNFSDSNHETAFKELVKSSSKVSDLEQHPKFSKFKKTGEKSL